MRATGIAFADGIKAAGGSVDVVDLPHAGIKGNSHMIMMDKNNAEGRGPDPEMAGRQRPDQVTPENTERRNMHGTRILEEADRLMTVLQFLPLLRGPLRVCSARWRLRRSFSDGDLNYLRQSVPRLRRLLHHRLPNSSPPHEFDVNVPKTFAIARADSWSAYAWPRAFAGLFARNGLAISIIAALSVAAFMFGFAVFDRPASADRRPYRPGCVLRTDAAQRDGAGWFGRLPCFMRSSRS